MLKIQTVTVERGASVDNGNSKSYDYTATFTSSEYGTFTYEMQLEVYKKTKFYLVAWTPANVVTGMNWYDRIYSSTLKGKRGEIFDRDGRVIVQNDYAITVYAEKAKVEARAGEIADQVAKILGEDAAQVRQAYEKSTGSTAIFATMFKGELSQEQEDALLAIEGVKVDRNSITPIRYYPYGNALAQTLGYSTPVTVEDRENEKYKNLLEGTRVGRSGLELAYDEYLQPENGMQIYLLSDDSKTKTVLYEKPARDGYDLVLTVDILLQKM